MTQPSQPSRGPRRPTRDGHEERKLAALAKGVHEFNTGEYYECHETLEEVWLEEPGDDVLFLQGLIQAAAAFHNGLKGKWGGSERLLAAALEKLTPYGEAHLGVDLARLLDDLTAARQRVLALARKGGKLAADEIPRIHFVD